MSSSSMTQDDAPDNSSNATNSVPLSVATQAFRHIRYVWVILFLLGLSFNLITAFTSAIWFDESYSIALARHSLADIWRIGSADVHPVLYYWMLHGVVTLFGQNPIICRLFSVAGLAACAALGWIFVRRDIGYKTCLGYTFIVLFSPWALAESVDIRMYSWAAFFVMFTFLMCSRIARRVLNDAQEDIPLQWWIGAFAGAIACAYMHYFSCLAAALCLLFVLIALIAGHAARPKTPYIKRQFVCFGIGLIICILAYMPWLHVLFAQVSHVRQGFWISLTFPDTFLDIALFPTFNETIESLVSGGNGLIWQVVCLSALSAFVAACLAALVLAGRNACMPLFRRGEGQKFSHIKQILIKSAFVLVSPSVAAGFVYIGTIVISLIISLSISPVLMARYLFVVIGPFAIMISTIFVRARRSFVVSVGIASLSVLALCSQINSAIAAYDPLNERAIAYYREITQTEDGYLPVVVGVNVYSDIQPAGILAVAVPEVPITLDNTYVYPKGDYDAYEAFSPALTISDEKRPGAFEDYQGKFVCVTNGTEDDPIFEGYPGTAVDYAATSYNASGIIESKSFYMPYKSLKLTITVMER